MRSKIVAMVDDDDDESCTGAHNKEFLLENKFLIFK